jgi:hypothetical protein
MTNSMTVEERAKYLKGTKEFLNHICDRIQSQDTKVQERCRELGLPLRDLFELVPFTSGDPTEPFEFVERFSYSGNFEDLKEAIHKQAKDLYKIIYDPLSY